MSALARGCALCGGPLEIDTVRTATPQEIEFALESNCSITFWECSICDVSMKRLTVRNQESS